MTLKEALKGNTVTVTKISGSRDFKKSLENVGIMPGSDLTMIDIDNEGSRVMVKDNRREHVLTFEEAGSISVTERFGLREGEERIVRPGCC